MPEIKLFKCFVSSPSDTVKERDACDKAFAYINKTIGQSFNFRVEGLRWESDVRPAFGNNSQQVINNQIGKDYDIFIGIMAKKFGTPTSRAGSGTEEEFNQAYDRFVRKEKVELMFYFSNEQVQLNDVDGNELEKVKAFKRKIATLGGLYNQYASVQEFEEKIRNHLTNFFLKEVVEPKMAQSPSSSPNLDALQMIYQKRLHDALQFYSTQPIIWAEPVLSRTNEISASPDKNFANRVNPEDFVADIHSTVIKAPPQFGLTSLAHHLTCEALKQGVVWLYLDASKCKAHSIIKTIDNEAKSLGLTRKQISCIIIDSWNNWELDSYKKLNQVSTEFASLPLVVLQTIDDSKFSSKESIEKIEREFEVLHLLALPRTEIRKVVAAYNNAKGIGEENVVLNKILADLDVLNIHRTPSNCITLLKVCEKHFDESPINRTKMLEMVLFVLFNMDEVPTYKTKPDLKDCEFVLGRYCEQMIRTNSYEFTREHILKELKTFCTEKLIDLEVDVVFDVLRRNNIITRKDNGFAFRSSYWIFYFAAKRMHIDPEFASYIFSSKKYISFPEIVEFYTGIDRNREDALEMLRQDLSETCDIVKLKIGLSDDLNPFKLAKWNPTAEHLNKIREEISDHVMNSNLPDSLKDQHADRQYNQLRPYNQSIQAILEEYSVLILLQKIKASARALRNSDYVSPNVKRKMLAEILTAWEQIAKVLLVLTPILADKGSAVFEGVAVYLDGNFGDTFEERVNRIFQVTHTNVVGFFKADLFSSKMGPLLHDHFVQEKNDIKKHQLALLLIFERPRDWRKHIQDYISSLPKESFYLFNVVNALMTKYKYDFVSESALAEIGHLIKLGLAKHEFGDKNPLRAIGKISNANLPTRRPKQEGDE